ncbi:thiamine biosynthesis protein ThiC [Altererythrobacter sp. MF3-039]|uniref:thiamine biosynthesis protein ThiC n=1 Tax=Altererythrobacter sp. MF3-039 TaxID=3252901 RepID=UPI00390CB614
MDFTLRQTVRTIAALLITAAVTQSIYTAMYIAEMTPPRQLMWGLEALIFVLLAAFAGSALAQAKTLSLGFAAIAFAAALNVVQVGIGLTMFEPFFGAAEAIEALGPIADSILAFSFMVYNAAKILLGLAAIVFGMAKANAGSKALGGLTVIVGGIAMLANSLSMAIGRDFMGEIPLAGGSGVLATILLALCLSSVVNDD